MIGPISVVSGPQCLKMQEEHMGQHCAVAKEATAAMTFLMAGSGPYKGLSIIVGALGPSSFEV